MQPFKMLVGDMVNEKQKAKAYSIQSFLCNAGSLAGYLFPILFTAIGIANVAPEGQVPDSVKWSFYVGAAILILCVIYTTANVKEYDPEQMRAFQEAAQEENRAEEAAGGSKNKALKVFIEVGVVQFFCWFAFMYMWTYTNGTISDTVWHTSDTASAGYQTAGNWVGVLFAVQAVGSVLWAMALPFFKNIKVGYALSLVIGGIGFMMVPYIGNQYLLFVPYFLIGFAWAAMLAMPFTLVTNALEGSKYMGTFLGLFNCTICIPQIVAAALGGVILSALNSVQGNMLMLAGVLLVVGAVCVFFITTKKHEATE
jgi:maltose/moltooligosaccharide transporter